MKSVTILAISAALATAASAYKEQNDIHDLLTQSGVQIETRPPVVVIETVTRTKTVGPHETGGSHWKSHKYNKEGHYGHDEDEDEDDDEEGDDYHHDYHQAGNDEGTWGKSDYDGIHANSLAPKASNHNFFAAAAVSSLSTSITSAVASKISSVSSKASSAAAAASSSVVAKSGGSQLQVGGTIVAGIAGVAAYMLL